jgi:hypothetical protein
VIILRFPVLSPVDVGASGLSDQDAMRFNISHADKSDLLEEILTELSVYYGTLYHLIEVFKGHEDFAEELSRLN